MCILETQYCDVLVLLCAIRSASGDELHPQGHAASAAHRPPGLFTRHHLRYHGTGALQVQNA